MVEKAEYDDKKQKLKEDDVRISSNRIPTRLSLRLKQVVIGVQSVELRIHAAANDAPTITYQQGAGDPFPINGILQKESDEEYSC